MVNRNTQRPNFHCLTEFHLQYICLSHTSGFKLWYLVYYSFNHYSTISLTNNSTIPYRSACKRSLNDFLQTDSTYQRSLKNSLPTDSPASDHSTISYQRIHSASDHSMILYHWIQPTNDHSTIPYHSLFQFNRTRSQRLVQRVKRQNFIPSQPILRKN